MVSLLEKYRDMLPLSGVTNIRSLGEGNTPLVKADSLNTSGGLFLKMEQLNPTGSFKDRFGSLEAALIANSGNRNLIATSSGNTGAAIAAYSAKYGLNCLLFVNEITPDSKLKQMLIYGAKVFRVKDFGISSELSAPIFNRLQEAAVEFDARLVISAYKYSPEGMEGVKTIAYEIVEQLGKVPDNVFVPVGGGGLLTGIWRGFKDLKARNIINVLPKIHAVQPQANDTVVTALAEGKDSATEVDTTTTVSGLAVQVDIDATRALNAVRESGGTGILVTDEDIFGVQKDLCEREGIYVEPAGATSTAGYLKAVSDKKIDADEISVCVLTGHGLKDSRKNSSAGKAVQITLSDINETLFAK